MCGWIYDENTGAPDEGISPGTRWEDIPNDWACPLCGSGGTRWEDIPNDWVCPLCGSGKEDFDMVEI